MKTVHQIAWVLIAALVLLLNIGSLISNGMFMDAVQYVGVSRNLAIGKGSFWQLYQCKIGQGNFLNFHEQPPLLFYIQSIFFKIFGSSMYTERIYLFCTFLVIAFCIYKMWQFLSNHSIVPNLLNYIPLLFWIAIPTVFWGFSNCVHETGMYMFTTAASCLAIYNLMYNKQLVYWMPVGLLVFAATLSKGLPGLFPIAIPFLYFICCRTLSFSKMVLQTGTIIALIVLPYFIIIQSNALAANSLHIYFFDRLLARVNSEATVSNRFQTLVYLINDLLPLCIPIVLIFIFKVKWQISTIQKKYALFFLLLGLSATAPLMLTKIQRSFYNIPCFPFFAIAFAIVYQQAAVHCIQWLQSNAKRILIFKTISIAALFAGILFCITSIGSYKRDKVMLQDVAKISNYLPAFQNVYCNNVLAEEWSLRTYLIRENNIELNNKDSTLPYILCINADTINTKNYTQLQLGLQNYQLWQAIK